MADKVYCIVKKGKYYYIPDKAKTNPYNGKPAYLACLPNFFGGTKEDGESSEQSLTREVREESQGNVSLITERADQLADRDFSILYRFRYARAYRRVDNYVFYLVTMPDDGREYFAENCLALDMGATVPEDQREMSCIMKIPVADLAGGMSVNTFLGYCKNFAGDWVNIDSTGPDGKENKALSDWLNHQGTKDAFAVLLRP